MTALFHGAGLKSMLDIWHPPRCSTVLKDTLSAPVPSSRSHAPCWASRKIRVARTCRAVLVADSFEPRRRHPRSDSRDVPETSLWTGLTTADGRQWPAAY